MCEDDVPWADILMHKSTLVKVYSCLDNLFNNCSNGLFWVTTFAQTRYQIPEVTSCMVFTDKVKTTLILIELKVFADVWVV